MTGVGVNSSDGLIGTFILDPHAPDLRELALRLLWSWPLAIFATLAALWIFRRLKSRRPLCRRSDRIGGMRFSLRALFVFIAIEAVLFWGCVRWPVTDFRNGTIQLQTHSPPYQ